MRQHRELTLVVLLQQAVLAGTEVEIIQFALSLELFGNHIETEFLGAAGIPYFTSNLAAAELLIACFDHIELLPFCLDLHIVDPLFPHHFHIVALKAPHLIHDGTKLVVDIYCYARADSLIGIRKLFFKKGQAIACYTGFRLDVVILCISFNNFGKYCTGIAAHFVNFIVLHIPCKGIIGLNNLLLLILNHFSNKLVGLGVLFGIPDDVGIFVGLAKDIGQKNRFICKGARYRDLQEVCVAKRYNPDSILELRGMKP